MSTDAEVAVGATCGTYAGYQRHKREGTEPCTPCRKANRAYQAEYRARRPESVERDHQRRDARYRAFVRLAELHPGQFQILLDQEDPR